MKHKLSDYGINGDDYSIEYSNPQTAVEWLEQRIRVELTYEQDVLFDELFEQAKAMERQQREKDFVEGYKTRALASNLIFDKKSEYYATTLFNRTYKTE